MGDTYDFGSTGFNANEAPEQRSFDPLPPGDYLVTIEASERRKVKDNPNASYLWLEMQVLDGPHKNRKLWANLNLEHPNNDTVQIAKAQLGAICKAVNIIQPKHSHELHGLPLVVAVKLSKRNDTGEMTNKITGFYPKTRVQQVAAAPAASGQAPWAR